MENISIRGLAGDEAAVGGGAVLEIAPGFFEGKLSASAGCIKKGVGVGGAVLFQGKHFSILRKQLVEGGFK